MNDNLMTGIMELILVGHQQLIERATASFGSVPVNNGPIAFIVWKSLILLKR